MHDKKKSPWLRLIAFLILPIASIFLFNQILIPNNEGIFYLYHELSHRDDVELALVGSSVVQSHFNPHIISDITGLETFCVSAGHMAMPGSVAATKFMYQSNKPQYVCLVVEPDTFNLTAEHRQTQQLLLPCTTNPFIAIPYYLDLCSQDGMYFDRLFVFRSFMAQSWKDVRDAIHIRLDPEGYFHQAEIGKSGLYNGRGYYRNLREGNGADALRFVPLLPTQDIALKPGIEPYFIKKLTQYKALCEKNGSQLIVVMSPNMIAHALAKEGYVQKQIELADLCAQMDIPYFNFYLAKEDFLPRLDHYFVDTMHMDYHGADLFSEKFAEVFLDYIAGKETDHLFYHTADEFFATIHCITNTWINSQRQDGQDVYTAGCLHGASITPEYSFHLLAPDGTTTLVQPYSTNATYSCPSGALAGQKLRVYARPQGSSEESLIFYDIACRAQ